MKITAEKKEGRYDRPSPNGGLAQAGHCLVEKCLQNSKLCGSLQVCVSPACAKPLHVKCNGGIAGVIRKALRVGKIKKKEKMNLLNDKEKESADKYRACLLFFKSLFWNTKNLKMNTMNC